VLRLRQSNLEYPGRLSLRWLLLLPSLLLLPPYLSRRSHPSCASTVQNEALGRICYRARPVRFAAIASYVEPLNVTTSYWL